MVPSHSVQTRVVVAKHPLLLVSPPPALFSVRFLPPSHTLLLAFFAATDVSTPHLPPYRPRGTLFYFECSFIS